MRIPFSRPRSASIASAGPLSVGVPLEGTDTVPGLRALERRAAAEGIARLLGVAAANGFAPGRKYTRYRGPYLDQLTLESLKAEPKKWGEFFGFGRGRSGSGGARGNRKKKEKTGGGDGDTSDDKPSSPSSSPPPPLPPSWTLPMSMLALRERAEENLVAFLPNYLRALAALVVLLAALGGRPLSLVGLACLAAFAVANARGLFGGPSVAETIARKQQQLMLEQQQQQQRAAGQAPPPPAPPRAAAAAAAGEEQAPPARAAATVFVYGVAAYTRAFAPLTKGIALVILLAAFHACLRVAATERAAWTAAASAERQRKVPSYAAAGVPFRDAAFGAPRAEASAQRDEKDQEDPRRCLRELEAAARALASAAAIGAKAGAAAGVDAAVAKAKALRQQLR